MKIDLKKQLKEYYTAPAKLPVIVDVPEMSFLMADGTGDPNTSKDYPLLIEALFAMSYGAKFHIKKTALGVDYGVMPLEGLWWTDNLADFSMTDRRPWKWTAMIMQPEWVTPDILDVARKKAENKLGRALDQVYYATLAEGQSAQVMHVGPYSDEPPTIAALHQFIADNGRQLRGKHHEIYLGDPRRTKPERLKTVIRQPIA